MSCWPRVRTTGVTAATEGTSFEMARPSSGLSVVVLPAPKEKPPDDAAPGKTIIRLRPIELICFSTMLDAPWPMATIAMTEAMPMTMPSIVRKVRTLLRPSCLTARWIEEKGFMPPPPG